MDREPDRMEKFDFLLGNWKLKYHVPKSSFSEADTGTGEGTIRKILGGRYVQFDYRASLNKAGTGSARGIFAWDQKARIYRYWWFEDSGNFLTAAANFVDEGTLRLNWHDTLLVQTFKKRGPDQMILRMEQPVSGGTYELILEVQFSKK
jgi:hypothetical protein